MTIRTLSKIFALHHLFKKVVPRLLTFMAPRLFDGDLLPVVLYFISNNLCSEIMENVSINVKNYGQNLAVDYGEKSFIEQPFWLPITGSNLTTLNTTKIQNVLSRRCLVLSHLTDIIRCEIMLSLAGETSTLRRMTANSSIFEAFEK